MKIFKPLIVILCISNILSSASKNHKKAKGRKLCIGCESYQSMHQNPYMYSMMSGGMGYNPYMANPMMGGMMNPMASMAFNPFMMGMGPAAMPAMPNMGNPYAMNNMGQMNNTNMYPQDHTHYVDDMKLNKNLFKSYHNMMNEDFSNDTQQLQHNEPVNQETAVEQPVLQETPLTEELQNGEDIVSAKRRLNAFRRNNYGQMGNRFTGF